MFSSYTPREKGLVAIIAVLLFLQLLGYLSTMDKANERRVQVEKEMYYSEHGDL